VLQFPIRNFYNSSADDSPRYLQASCLAWDGSAFGRMCFGHELRLSAPRFCLQHLVPAAASDSSFPFGGALFLDADPLPGLMRIPMIAIEDNGTAAFNLWCSTVEGTASVADDKIRIVPTKAISAQCTRDGLSRDAGLLAALSQVTGWRRNGDQIDFLGTTTLHFRLMTN
jgi:hypothetical protein